MIIYIVLYYILFYFILLCDNIFMLYIYISIILGVPWLSPEVWVATLVLVLFIISIITETCKFVQRICGAARFFFEAFGALNVSSNNSHCMDCIHNIYIYIYGNSPKK